MKKEPYILIVDDTPEHIQTAGTILKSHGYHVRIATGGRKALEIIQQSVPAILLLDIRMKDMDGFTLCEMLKNSPYYQGIAIIFVTADHDRYHLQKGFELGAQDYILKPYHPSELIARVNTQMKMYYQAEELNSAYKDLGQFCHNVSHDLKAPIHSIAALASELCKEAEKAAASDTCELQKIQQDLENRCTQTIHMVEHLLRFAELSESVLCLKEVPLSPFIREIADELIRLHPERNILLKLPPDLPVIRADESLLRHVFQNIIGNAIKFTSGKAQAILSFSSESDDFYHSIFLHDNGIGIDAPDPDRLFQVFERGTSEFEGSGIGLAIVKRIITMHGGQVSISGTPNSGTTIRICLPVT